ncbi:hypothetical protein G7046_g9928 [Stylonectria norvegica]|nr:hypothetical protein G7046_g9928 [Stylonectria norvegica]
MAENLTAGNFSQELWQGASDGFNTTLNGTVASSDLHDVKALLSFLTLEFKLVSSAMGIIYLSAHAALRRPPSAAPAKARKPGQEHDDNEDRFAQGLELWDAIMLPFMAGVVLIGLYFLIGWLKDPNILNKVLRWYMSTMSVASLLTLYAHGIELATTLLFPRYWRGRDGSLRTADQKTKTVSICDNAGNVTSPAGGRLDSPFPGTLGWLTQTERARKVGWEMRSLLTRHWVVKFFLHGVAKEQGKIKFAHGLALLMSLVTALVYSSTSSPLLSNMLGYAMCYGSALLLSPTDFLTGSMVLVGLFFYDIVMVFYTPYMITVATKLDVPIKLTFEAASRKSILGLGDIVIPGMVIALALRFDLWIHYVRKMKYESTDLKLVEKDATSGEVTTRSETKHKEIKARYVEVKNNWGDSFWVRGALFLRRPAQLPTILQAARFSKVYFHAAMAGYLVGMLATLAMLLVFERGQPALLYLVPGVLGALWLTALARGEVKYMWAYTEDGSIDTVDVVVDLDAHGRAVKRIGKLEDGVVDTTRDEKKEAADKEVAKVKRESEERKEKSAKVFLLSVEALLEDDEDE